MELGEDRSSSRAELNGGGGKERCALLLDISKVSELTNDLHGKSVLVTGGAGFIGSHTVEALLASGACVTVFDNFSAGKKSNLSDGGHLRIIEGDLRDFPAVRSATENMDAVLHLAAQVSVRVSVDDPRTSAEHNLSGFLNVLEASRRAGIPRFVYASSAAVYGVPAKLPLDELSPLAPISPYGLEKQINEQYATVFNTLYGTRALGLRYFNVYGPRQDPKSSYAGVISKFSDCIGSGQPLTIFGDGHQTRDFVYVKDVARINVAALASDETGIVAVGTGRSVSLLELVDVLGRAANRKAEVNHAAPVTGDIPRSAMLPTKLKEVLGIMPSTSLEHGLRELLISVGGTAATATARQ